ncbi:MAG: hypothetical protein QXM89_05555 [Candidatus Bathyarchaeia archaeon]
MSKIFESQTGRLKLLNSLREEGYGVRMHAYEYFIRGKHFIAFIQLMPSRNLAVITGFKWNEEEFKRNFGRIVALIKRIDPTIVVESHLYR